MEAIRLHKVVKDDGEISITGLPCKKGQYVEMILLIEPSAMPKRPHLTARRLLHSELIGLWKDRKDIEDSAVYARQLREQAQGRWGLCLTFCGFVKSSLRRISLLFPH